MAKDYTRIKKNSQKETKNKECWASKKSVLEGPKKKWKKKPPGKVHMEVARSANFGTWDLRLGT